MKHIHNWHEAYTTLDYKYDMLHFKCTECGEWMMPEDVVRCLNAVEQLSSDEARRILRIEAANENDDMWVLHHYANVLDGVVDGDV